MPKHKPEPLTRAQKEQLEAELAELEGPKRAAMVEAIATARSFGDLSENFEYHAAKNEQGLLERRITILRDRLDRAVLVDETAPACADWTAATARSALDAASSGKVRPTLFTFAAGAAGWVGCTVLVAGAGVACAAQAVSSSATTAAMMVKTVDFLQYR